MTNGNHGLAVSVTVNDERYEATVEPRLTLADFLREELHLTGTKLGCEHGVCGACTVLLDGAAVRSCLVLAVQASGRNVSTVEGLAQGTQLNPLQEAFRRHHALQCGFCTAGFLMTVTALLREKPTVDEAEIREALSANLCRCTGYQSIVEAVAEVAGDSYRAMRGEITHLARERTDTVLEA